VLFNTQFQRHEDQAKSAKFDAYYTKSIEEEEATQCGDSSRDLEMSVV
jgi:hypothetical protein